MHPFDRASLLVIALMMVTILAGMTRRRLFRLCFAFALYLSVVGFGNTLIALSPATFYNWHFWQVKDLTYTVLTLLVALEIAALSFQAFPGARRRALQLAVVILVATLAAVALAPAAAPIRTPVGNIQAILYLEVQPRLAHGTVMLFAGLWGLVLWYVIPLHRWHRAILRGLVPYLLASTVAVRLLASWGWEFRAWVGYAESIAYMLVLAYWAWEAWRPESSEERPEILGRLQPWLDKR